MKWTQDCAHILKYGKRRMTKYQRLKRLPVKWRTITENYIQDPRMNNTTESPVQMTTSIYIISDGGISIFLKAEKR